MRGRFKQFVIISLGLILPGIFLSFLGLRSVYYEGVLLERQVDERYASDATLIEKKAEERISDWLSALRLLASDSSIVRLDARHMIPFLLSTSKLGDIPVDNFFVVDN